MSKHTPAPWREFRDGDSHDIIGPDGTHIATMEPRNGFDPRAEQDADARLIALAPRMLEALEDANALLGEILRTIADNDTADNIGECTHRIDAIIKGADA